MQTPNQQQPTPAVHSSPVNTNGISQEADIFAALEKLAVLKDKGILTDSEYSTKKAELLARL
ncbi:MAG: SHOCT domain-containing protein [Methylococcales bacterium]|nr:SHOCT domain-containing protein [Methylococcales bacterium]